MLYEKQAILPYRVPAEWRFLFLAVWRDKGYGILFRQTAGILRGPDAIQESGCLMMLSAPFFHRIEDVFRIIYRKYRAFCNNIELSIGHDCRDFDNDLLFMVEPCHFQVYPDQVVIQFGLQYRDVVQGLRFTVRDL
jgi:hypothetical protein